MKISAIALDDEPKALQVIKHHAAKIEELELKACFQNPREALNYLREEPVQLLFLDINMPQLSGFDFIQELKNDYAIIFTTAYSEYAVQSYEVKALDYLLKPFEFDRFWQAFQKVMAQKEEFNKGSQVDFIFVGDGYKKVRVEFNDIYLIEASGNYMNFITEDQKVLSRMRMYEVLGKLPSDRFFRIHNSYIINLEKVEKIEHNLVYIHQQSIPLSAKYREAFLAKIASWS